MNPLELIKFIESAVKGETQQLNALALMADAPSEEYIAAMRLPVQNELPAFALGDAGVGSDLANLDYGVAAPVPGQEATTQSIGELLIGEVDAI